MNQAGHCAPGSPTRTRRRRWARSAVIALSIVMAITARPDHAEATSFTDVTTSAGVDYLQWNRVVPPVLAQDDMRRVITGGATVIDFDADGWSDLYVTGIDTAQFYLYINQGDGTFAEDAVARGAALSSLAQSPAD